MRVTNDNYCSTSNIRRTCEVWKPRLGQGLCDENARWIAADVTGFFSVLAKPSQAGPVEERNLSWVQLNRSRQFLDLPPKTFALASSSGGYGCGNSAINVTLPVPGNLDPSDDLIPWKDSGAVP